LIKNVRAPEQGKRPSISTERKRQCLRWPFLKALLVQRTERGAYGEERVGRKYLIVFRAKTTPCPRSAWYLYHCSAIGHGDLWRGAGWFRFYG
jgi:hypothetical protein